MNLRILLLAIMTLLPCFVHAQNQSIQGQITESNGKPVENAGIVLQRAKDSTYIAQAITDASGKYKITTTDFSGTQLRVEAYGYMTQVRKLDGVALSLGIDFALEQNKVLSEVTITSRKPVYEQKVDRTVFNVENSITAIGNDAWGALKKTPGVLIMNNQVTIAGKGSVGIMINGRMQQVSGDDIVQLLHSIPSDNLSRIEVITTPPARYDAEGNTGIINIVTKKTVKQGLKGSATANYKRNNYDNPSLSTVINYGRGKLNAYCNANAGINAYLYTNRTNTFYPGQKWEQNLDQGVFNKSVRLQLGADYNITPNTILGLTVSEAYNKNEQTDSLISTSINDAKGVDSVIRSHGETNEWFKGKHTVNMNYEWKIDTTGKKLNVDADYYTHKGHRVREFDAHNYMNDGSTTTNSDNRMTGNPAITIKSIKADFELPLKFAKLSMGSKLSDVYNKADNVYETLIGGKYAIDATRTNAFEYKEQIQALYISANKKFSKYEMQFGLRAERTQTRGYSATVAQTTVRDYTDLFPSGYLQYTPNSAHVFSISYSRRINRPWYSLLNPFRFFYSSNAYIEGDPNLLPSYRNGVEMNYTLKSKYFFKVFAVKTDNYWDRIIETDTITGSTRYTRANIGTAKWLGVNTSYMFNPTPWWEFRVGVNGEYNHFQLSHFSNSSTTSSVFCWFETNQSFVLDKKKTWSAELYAYYYSPRQKDYKIWDRMSTVNFGFRKLLMNKNLILALNFEDIFAKAYWYQTNIANGTTEYSYDNDNGVRFTATYKFGNKSVRGKRDRNNSVEEIQRANQQ